MVVSAITDRVETSFKAESVFATDPGGTFQALRITSDSLMRETDTEESEELRADRQTADIIRTNIRASGALGYELTYGSFDEMIAAALMSSWSGDSVSNGVAPTSFAIQRKYTDLTNVGALYLGMMINQWQMTIPTNGRITGSFDFIGKDESSVTSLKSATAVNTNQVMNSIDHIGSVTEGGASASSILSASFSLNNNLRAQPQIGTLGPVGIGLGNINLTGSLRQYFLTSALMDKYLSFTESSLVIVIADTAGNTYTVTFPRIKYTSGKRVAGGQNQDIVADMEWTAIRDPSTGVSMTVARAAA